MTAAAVGAAANPPPISPPFWTLVQAFCKITLDPGAGADRFSHIDQSKDVQMQTWAPGDRCYCWEPLFVPRKPGTPGYTGECRLPAGQHSSFCVHAGRAGVRCPLLQLAGQPARAHTHSRLALAGAHAGAEDDGWLIGSFSNAATDRGHLAIFDARDIAQGPIASIQLPHHLPTGLHGSWCEEYFGPPAGSAAPKWAQPNRIRPL